MNNDLDNLDHIATQADTGAIAMDTPPGAEGEGGELAAQGVDYMTEARGTVDMFTAMMVGYAPKTESVWTEPAKARTAAALAPVMEKYGFNFGALPPELTLVIVAGPLLWQSSKIVAAQMAEDKAKAAKEKPKEDKTDPMTMAMKPPGQYEEAPAQEVHDQVKLYK
jgi:hypothetical protein